MDPRFGMAQLAGSASTWLLQRVLHRAGGNFPGKAGLAIDPQLLAHLHSRLREGCVMVVGTNGKTTVTNMLADAFAAAGKAVACNRTGANLDSGVATALLHAGQADWGIFESDELWLAHTAPQLQPRYVVLLNLFRDQLDRMGEIDHIQASIVQALDASPGTTLLFNCDDPLCQGIASQVGNRTIPFGIGESLGLAQNAIADAGMCQRCEGMLSYAWRQYGQLGAYRCPSCGFERDAPLYQAHGVSLQPHGVSLRVQGPSGSLHVDSQLPGAYMAYNILAACAAAQCCGLPAAAIAKAVGSFAPHNGRLQRYEVDGTRILLNLAKNPTGFNQNIRIVRDDPHPKAVAFFVNDKEADGHDVSWLWDVDFQELAGNPNLAVFAGGIRRNDVQVRLKHAGVDAILVDDARDFLSKATSLLPACNCYLIANYTTLPGAKGQLDRMQHLPPAYAGLLAPQPRHCQQPAGRHLTIVHLYPELLNLYGDSGNVAILANRARWRGIRAEVVCVHHGQEADLTHADIVFLGGGPDREQHLASQSLLHQAQALRAFVEDDGVLLAICGGYQILGHTWIMGGESVPGLGIVDVSTERAPGGSHNRLVGNIVLESPVATMPVVGYENHAGRTFLGAGVAPFGRILQQQGCGNNDADGTDGVHYRNVLGTYLHGPLLAKNPEVADFLLDRALARQAAKGAAAIASLPALDDAPERAANAFMLSHLGVRHGA